MLRKILQRSLTKPNLVQPIVKRAFSISAIRRQESDTLRPTSGKHLYILLTNRLFFINCFFFTSRFFRV